MTGRRRPPGARTLLREHFLKNIGRVMDKDELQDVARGAKEFGRRIRELRNEEGYKILTHNDRSGLKPGEYLLEDPEPAPAFAREISKETRAYVLERNGATCQKCGAAAGEPHPADAGRKTRLHIGHIIDKSKGGTDEPSNLYALCSVCNEGIQNISPMRPDRLTLLTNLRRATSADQVAALEWLIRKFPKQAAAALPPDRD